MATHQLYAIAFVRAVSQIETTPTCQHVANRWMQPPAALLRHVESVTDTVALTLRVSEHGPATDADNDTTPFSPCIRHDGKAAIIPRQIP
jgi:hypothetical protein